MPIKKPVSINPDYLKQKIRESGLSESGASVKMGFEKPYVTTCLAKGVMNETALRLLCTIVGADFGEATSASALPQDGGRPTVRANSNFWAGLYKKDICIFMGSVMSCAIEQANGIERIQEKIDEIKQLQNLKDRAVAQAVDETAEIVLDDLKEVGKIGDDIKREVRETRDAMKEALVKMQTEQHEILTVLRNMQASNRESLTAIHNDLVKKK